MVKELRKIVITHQCEVCKKKFADKNMAQDCENRISPDDINLGDVWGYENPDGDYGWYGIAKAILETDNPHFFILLIDRLDSWGYKAVEDARVTENDGFISGFDLRPGIDGSKKLPDDLKKSEHFFECPNDFIKDLAEKISWIKGIVKQL